MIEVTQLVQEIVITTVDETTVLVTTQDPSPGQTGILFEDEGISLGTRGTVNEINFVGSGVSAARSTDKLTVTVTSGGGSGTVTQVGAPAFYTVSNPTTTPIFALQTQVKNLVLAGPVSGLDAIPTYRALVAADLPDNSGNVSLPILISPSAPNAITNQPLAEFYYISSNRHVRRFDASMYNECRLVANVTTGSASASSPRLYIKYKTSFAPSTDLVGDFTTVGSGTGTDSISLTNIAGVESNWITIPAGAKADVYWCIGSAGGDGGADPALGMLEIQFRL